MSQQLRQIEKAALDVLLNLSLEQLQAVCYKMVTESSYDARALSSLLEITEGEAICLMMNPQFLNVFRDVRLNIKKFEFLGKSLDALSELVETGEADIKIKAINSQANILGFNKQQIDVNTTINIENVLDRIGKEKIVDIETIPGLD